MQSEQVKKIREAKELLNGLEKIPLMEVLVHIEQLIKNYEAQHKA